MPACALSGPALLPERNTIHPQASESFIPHSNAGTYQSYMKVYNTSPLADQGVVHGIDRERFLKEYSKSVRGDLERQAFERLEPHPKIERYLGSTREGSVSLGRGRGLPKILQKPSAHKIPLRRKLAGSSKLPRVQDKYTTAEGFIPMLSVVI